MRQYAPYDNVVNRGTPVLIAGPNLTIDRTLELDELRPGEVLRFTSAAVTPGGKGVNVARVARELAAPAVLVGFVPGRTGAAAAGLLADEGLDLRAVEVAGEVRSATVIIERGGRTTVLNEPGPRLGAGDWERLERVLGELLAGHRVLVCSGSVPPGAPPDAYARLVELARARSLPTLVDATGPLLDASLSSSPFAVTPNLEEAESVLGPGGGDVRRRALAAAERLAERGVEVAVVTAGAAGVAVAHAGERRWVEAPRVEVRNSVGAGDSFAGGFASALERGEDVWAAVAFGTAVAAASVESPLAGGLEPGRARALLDNLDWM